jgi:membrane protease YdiL (CAAX protease family)
MISSKDAGKGCCMNSTLSSSNASHPEGTRRKGAILGFSPSIGLFAAFGCLALASPALASQVGVEGVQEGVQKTAEAIGTTATQAADSFTKLFKSDPWLWGHTVAAGVVIIALLLADVIRPGSLERAGKRSVEPHSAALWFSCALLVAGAQIVGGAFAQFVPGKYRGDVGTPQNVAVLAGLQYLTAIVTAVVLARLIAGSSKGSGLAFTARSLAWGTAAGVMAWPIVIASSFGFVLLHQNISGEQVQRIAHPTLQMLLDNRNDAWAWSMAVMAIIAAPVVEEVIYRGFIQSSILKLTGRPWTSIIITSILFAGAHMLPAILVALNKGESLTGVIPWYSAATVGVLGLCMGIAFERTKEIGVPITMHVIFNAMNVALATLVATNS